MDGPFCDLEDLNEKQRTKRLVMQLRLLDLRENRLTQIHLKDAATFLRETVVLMWDNPFTLDCEIGREYNDPSSLFRASSEFGDDYRQIQNPLHLYQPLSNRSILTELIAEEL